MLVRIVFIVEGAKGTSKFNKCELDYEFARDCGLLKHSNWLYDMRVGDTAIVPKNELSLVIKNGEGVYTLEVLRPKYANQHLYSDVYPYEIVEWVTDRKLRIRRMKPCDFNEWTDGHCNRYESDESNPVITVREHKNGGFYDAGSKCCPYILAESPYYYRDPSF